MCTLGVVVLCWDRPDLYLGQMLKEVITPESILFHLIYV